MTKTQKIWLWVFLAMFVVPEVLWSPILNETITPRLLLSNSKGQLWRYNFLFDKQNIGLLRTVVLAQLLGIAAATVVWLLSRKQVRSKAFFWAIVLLLALGTIYTFFVYQDLVSSNIMQIL